MLPRFNVPCPVLSYHITQHNTTNENREIKCIFVGCEFSVGVFCCLRWRWSVVACPCLVFVFPVLLRIKNERK